MICLMISRGGVENTKYMRLVLIICRRHCDDSYFRIIFVMYEGMLL